jgi:hypothetical protein
MTAPESLAAYLERVKNDRPVDTASLLDWHTAELAALTTTTNGA